MIPIRLTPRAQNSSTAHTTAGLLSRFSSGPRICGGMKLARIELLQGLKAFVRHFKVTRNDTPVYFDYTLAMRPVDHGQLLIKPRRTG